MKFQCKTKAFGSSVRAASGVINNGAANTILANVLITAHENRVHVIGSDGLRNFETWFDAEVEMEGSAAVPAKLLGAYLSSPAAEHAQVELSNDNTHTLTIRQLRSTYAFKGEDPMHFPATNFADEHTAFSITAGELRDVTRATTFATAREEARGVQLQSVLLHITAATTTAYATDGYRCSIRTLTVDAPETETVHDYLIQAGDFDQVTKNIMNVPDAEEVLVSVDQQAHSISFKTQYFRFSTRLVNEKYPDIDRIVPTTYLCHLIMPTAPLIAALRRAEIMANSPTAMVKIEVGDDMINLLAENETTGTAYDEVEATTTGENMEIAFNARYLLEMLNHIGTPEVRIDLSGPLTPALLRPQGNTDNQRYILMPLRK